MRSPRLAPLALLGALTLATACSKNADKQPTVTNESKTSSDAASPAPAQVPMPAVTVPTTDSAPVANNEGVIATLQIPTGLAMADVAALIDNVKPGVSTFLKLQAPGAVAQALGMDLSGAQLDGPLSLVVVNPMSNPKPFALLVGIEDEDKLASAASVGGLAIQTRDGYALLGEAAVVDQTASFAFANLKSTPDHSEIVLYPQAALTQLRPQLDAALAQFNATLAASPSGAPAAKFFEIYMDGLVSMVEQTDRVVVSFGVSQTSSDVFMRLYPKSGSMLAAFVAAQTPADHALLTKLPGGEEPPGVLSGVMTAGAARDALIDWSVEFMASMYQTDLTPEQWQAVMRKWLDTFDGNFATAIEMDLSKASFAMTGLLGATDGVAMRAAWREMATAMTSSSAGSAAELMGMKFTITFTPDAMSILDVPVDLFRTTLDLSAMPEEQRAIMEAAGTTDQAMHFAAFDNYAVMASAQDDGATVRAAIDTARGNTPGLQPSADLAAALAASKQNGESLLYYIDFARFVPPDAAAAADIPFGAMVMGLGKHGEALSMRLSLRK